MKKLIISAIICFSILFSTAQSFNGVPISGDLPTAISRFKAKGFTFVRHIDKIAALMKGTINGEKIDLYLYYTPKTNKFCKAVVYFEEETSWYSLKGSYDKFYKILLAKYGESDDKYEYFIDPYFKGDGYELQAIKLEKAVFTCLWFEKDNLNLAIEISKYKQVKVVYENSLLIDVKSKEQEELDAVIF